MSALVWDATGSRIYETGVDHGVLYPVQNDGTFDNGVAWNGLSSVSQSPSGAEASPIWADNIKYLNLISAEEYAATVEAYTYPDEFAVCDGSASVATGVYAGQQTRKPFGLVAKTLVGNDTMLNKFGYKLHLVYGALASPSEQSHATVNDSPEAATLSWEFSTTPVEMAGCEPTSYICIDSTKVNAEKLAALEAIVYGSEEAEPRLPLPTEVAELLKEDTAG